MTATQFTSADVKTVKRWSDRLYEDITTDGNIVSDAISAGILAEQKELSSGAGDQIKMHFRQRQSGKGLIDDETATGAENALTYHQDTMVVHESRYPVQIPNKNTISAQRVNFNLTEDAYQELREWYAERFTVGFFNQLAGNDASSITYDGETFTGATDLLKITGMNTVTAPSTNQILRANSKSTDAQVAADSTATFNLEYILQLENMARKNRPYIRKIGKGPVNYRLYLHTDGFLQGLQDTSSAFSMRDIYYNQISGGKKDNSIDGTRFVFSETEIVVSDKLPFGVTSNVAESNARRAVFCGQEAGAIAFGQGYTVGSKTTPGFSFTMDEVDIQKWKRISGNAIYGINKAQYNSIDRGTIAFTHYVA